MSEYDGKFYPTDPGWPRPDGFGGVCSTPGGNMAIPNYYGEQGSSLQQQVPENMGSTLNCLHEFAKSALQRARDIEARIFGQPNANSATAQDQKLRPVQSVAEVIAETRALVGQTLDALDRIQAQL